MGVEVLFPGAFSASFLWRSGRTSLPVASDGQEPRGARRQDSGHEFRCSSRTSVQATNGSFED